MKTRPSPTVVGTPSRSRAFLAAVAAALLGGGVAARPGPDRGGSRGGAAGAFGRARLKKAVQSCRVMRVRFGLEKGSRRHA